MRLFQLEEQILVAVLFEDILRLFAADHVVALATQLLALEIRTLARLALLVLDLLQAVELLALQLVQLTDDVLNGAIDARYDNCNDS